MKAKFIKNEIEYIKCGDYYIPNLTVPNDKVYSIGKHGRLHTKFIKENRPVLYSMKILNGTQSFFPAKHFSCFLTTGG